MFHPATYSSRGVTVTSSLASWLERARRSRPTQNAPEYDRLVFEYVLQRGGHRDWESEPFPNVARRFVWDTCYRALQANPTALEALSTYFSAQDLAGVTWENIDPQTVIASLSAQAGTELRRRKRDTTPEPKALVGKSLELERRYTREEPKEEDLRALPVLRRAFDHVVTKARVDLGNSIDGLAWLSVQLKGIRQDMKCQEIENEFTIQVYEFHARLCLRLSDIPEYGQCQIALRRLYELGLQSAAIREFTCYRVLYLALAGQTDSLSQELRCHELRRVTAQVDPLLQALITSDGAAFCAAALACSKGESGLSEILPLVCAFLPKLRLHWLTRFVSAVRGQVPLRVLRRLLGFEGIDQALHAHLGTASRCRTSDPTQEAWSGFFTSMKMTEFPSLTDPTFDAMKVAQAAADYLAFLKSSVNNGSAYRDVEVE
jgi:hypothetical protein